LGRAGDALVFWDVVRRAVSSFRFKVSKTFEYCLDWKCGRTCPHYRFEGKLRDAVALAIQDDRCVEPGKRHRIVCTFFGTLMLVIGMPRLPAQEVSPRGAALLHWTGDRRQLDAVHIRIIRGQIHVRNVRSSGITVDVYGAWKTSSSPAVWIVPAVTGRTLQVMDVYPARDSNNPHECLPPTDERGDFWSSDVFLEVEITAPPGTKIEREVRAEAAK
jgi:hypothetical protein